MSRFRVELQRDSAYCGVACLRMLCLHWGMDFRYSTISEMCKPTAEGVSLLAVGKTAEEMGFSCQCVRIPLATLLQVTKPCILHWNQNHFVVLYKVAKGKYFYIADPAKGRIKLNADEFKKHWIASSGEIEPKGIAMLLEPKPGFFNVLLDENENNEQRSFKFLFSYIKQYHRDFSFVALGLLFGCVLQLLLPFLTQSIVDVGIKNKDIGFVWLILLGQLVLTISHTAIDFMRRWILLKISMRINISLVSDFFMKLVRLPMSFFDTKLMGDMIQRINDHDRVNSFLTQQTLNITFSVFSLIILSFVLLYYNWLIFLIFTVGSILYVGWLMLFLGRRKILDYELFEQQSINNNKTFELITSMQEVKLQNCEQRRRLEWENSQSGIFNVQMKYLKIQQIQEAGSIFINELKNIVITVVAATSVIHGQLTIGMMLAIQYIIGQLNSPVELLMNFCYSIQDVKISLERINEIHNMGDEDSGTSQNTYFETPNEGIEVEKVSFKYDPHALKKQIDNLTISIPQGKITAIVGASGSGKTTLLKLMLGYYKIQEGQISIGKTNIDTLNKKWWRKQCGVVMQDGFIFSESIARNIAIDDGEIDWERLQRASEIACINDYIMSLPLKYDTKIGRDGIGLSQGQKQRILIARAVYKNPDYIFLDEATNALDANNERMIVENLNQFYKGKTVVIVAHRLSTVKNADQIIVMDKGKIIEKGTHEELTIKQGEYYRLIKNQLELGN